MRGSYRAIVFQNAKCYIRRVDPQETTGNSETILAAGGILRRTGPPGEEIALVHRPKYDDWGLPKGKLAPGESLEQAALREVREETACEARLIRFIGTANYLARGRPKVVSFWLMEVVREHPFIAGKEIDRLAWLPTPEAIARMDYA